jgi:hypothetical protein
VPLLCQADTPPFATYFFRSDVAVLPFQIFIQDFKVYHTNLYIHGHNFNRFYIHVICPKFFTLFLLSFFFLPWCNSVQWAKASSLSRIHDHTHLDTRHSIGLSERVISPTQNLCLTTHDTKGNFPCPWRIRTHNPSKRAPADPRLRPRGH